MRYRVFLAGWLVVVWLALWRDLSLANLVSGVAVATATIFVFPPPGDRGRLIVRPLALLRFFGTALWAIVRANIVVAWEVVTPANQIKEGVVAVNLHANHPTVITLVSHAIGLAPGTMVIDVEDQPDGSARMYVHVLHLREIEDVRREVLDLERLALAAVAGRATTEEGAV